MNFNESNKELLRKKIGEVYALAELKILTFDLLISYEDLPGEILASKIISLIDFCCRHKYLNRLRNQLEKDRPSMNWDEINWDNVCSELGPPKPVTPYQGLSYFDVEDADRFFGRDRLVRELVDRIHKENLSFLAIVGASGSGKSSLVRAGLIPALTNHQNHPYGLPLKREQWLSYVITPGTHPLDELATALIPRDQPIEKVTKLIGDLANNAGSLNIQIRRLLQAQKKDRLLLLVDQFEELFTQTINPMHRQLFIDNLMYLNQTNIAGKALILITLRADFYTFCSGYDNLREAVEKHQKFIGGMSKSELIEVIERPVLGELQPGLTKRVLDDLGNDPGALPLLSHALLETWKHNRPEIMSIYSYEAVGGVSRAIAQTAESFYLQELTADEQEQMKELMLRLTTLGNEVEDTRRRVDIAHLEDYFGPNSNIRSLILRLSNTRLVTTDRKYLSHINENAKNNYVDTVQVTHESIIRNWQRLEDWINSNRIFLLWYQQFSDEVEKWKNANKDTGFLHVGSRLLETRTWFATHEPSFSSIQKEFILQSIQHNAKQQAEAVQGIAAFSRINIPFSNRSAGDLRIEQLLFQKLFMLERTEANQSAMLKKLEDALGTLNSRDNLFATFSPDGKWLAYGNSERKVYLWDWQSTEQKPIELGSRRHSQNIWWLAFSANGEYFVSPGSSPGSVEVWRLDELSKPVYNLSGLKFRIAQIQSLAISPDARWVVGGGVGHVAVIWDLKNELASQTLLEPNDGQASQIISMQFSTSGQWLGIRNEKSQLFLWRLQNGEWLPVSDK